MKRKTEKKIKSWMTVVAQVAIGVGTLLMGIAEVIKLFK